MKRLPRSIERILEGKYGIRYERYKKGYIVFYKTNAETKEINYLCLKTSQCLAHETMLNILRSEYQWKHEICILAESDLICKKHIGCSKCPYRQRILLESINDLKEYLLRIA